MLNTLIIGTFYINYVMAKFIRYCKTQEQHYGENVFDVSRPNILGNPYTHIKDRETKALVKVRNRDEAIDLYSPYFDKMYETDEIYKAEVDALYNAFKTFDEVYIGCYCKKEERCHSDVIIQKINQRFMKETLDNILKRK